MKKERQRKNKENTKRFSLFGDDRDRTDHFMRAKHVFYLLNYVPEERIIFFVPLLPSLIDFLQSRKGLLRQIYSGFIKKREGLSCLSVAGFEPAAIRLKARCSTDWAIHPTFDYLRVILSKAPSSFLQIIDFHVCYYPPAKKKKKIKNIQFCFFLIK